MKLIIDIPEVFYEALRKTDEIISGQRSGKTLMSVIFDAVANGTVLPEHGRLIDADDFKKKVCTYQQTGCGDCKHSLCCPEDAPTIIDAWGNEE